MINFRHLICALGLLVADLLAWGLSFELTASGYMLRIACIIPTYNGKVELSRLLASLKCQTAKFDTFVVDSCSSDGTQSLAIEHGLDPHVIPSVEFNHGGTRQLMVDRKVSNWLASVVCSNLFPQKHTKMPT